jgi:amino acid transporter
MTSALESQPELVRRITLPLVVLYGLGVTIGAGIYVLIGVSVAGAGIYAPASFLLAAFVMVFSACTFAELSGRLPQSAGEAIYVDAAFMAPWLTRLTGATVILGSAVAAATITLGSSGYIRSILDLPEPIVVTAIVLSMCAIAAYGILESVTFAAILTLIETAGLIAIIGAGLWTHPDIVTRLPEVLPPPSDQAALGAVFTTSLVAFFAFIGFDDIVNLAEEVKTPTRTLPLGIAFTLVIATLLYFMVVSVAVLTLPHQDLVDTGAPISLLFERLTGLPPLAITLIAIVATLNGIVIQIILGARVLYGLARKGRMPAFLAKVHPVTHTPVIGTLLISALILALALFFPIGRLAEMTTQAILVVFVFVNAALVRIKLRKDPVPKGIFTVPLWVPATGVVTCVALLVGPRFI